MEAPHPLKVLLRRQIQDRLDRLSPEVRAAQSRTLVELLTDWAPPQGFDTVLATLPFPDEPDVTAFLTACLAGGLSVALARTGPRRTLDFGIVTGLDGPWEFRPYGLREPSAEAPPWRPGPKTLALVPGLAFAPAAGGGAARLGRGAGYYDRWLALHDREVVSLGVAFSVQSLDSLPEEPHDRRLDGWIDPRGLHGLVRA